MTAEEKAELRKIAVVLSLLSAALTAYVMLTD